RHHDLTRHAGGRPRRPFGICHVAVMLHPIRAASAELALALDLVDVLPFDAPREVVPVALAERHAARQRYAPIAAVALVRLAGLQIGLESIETAIEDEIRDARERVGAVRGRSATRDDVYPLDEARG